MVEIIILGGNNNNNNMINCVSRKVSANFLRVGLLALKGGVHKRITSCSIYHGINILGRIIYNSIFFCTLWLSTVIPRHTIICLLKTRRSKHTKLLLMEVIFNQSSTREEHSSFLNSTQHGSRIKHLKTGESWEKKILELVPLKPTIWCSSQFCRILPIPRRVDGSCMANLLK